MKRTTVWAATAALLLTGVCQVAAVTPASAAAGCVLPLSIIKGRAETSTGQYMLGSEVVVRALPPGDWDGEVTATELGSATTGAAGNFEVRLCKSVPAALRDEDGYVNLVITGGSEEELLYSHVLAHPPTRSGLAMAGLYWTTDADVATSLGGTTVLGDLGISDGDASETATTISLRAHGADSAISEPAGTATTSEAVAAGTAEQMPYCKPGWTVTWRYTGATSRGWTPIQRFKTRGKLTEKFEWTTTKQTKLEYGIVTKGKKFGAGLSNSAQNASNTGVEVVAKPNSAFITWAEWEYKQYEVACSEASTASQEDYRRTDFRGWKPIRWTSGTKNVASAVSWSCQAKWTVSIANTTWVLKDRSVSWLGSVSVAGISVDANQKTGSATKVTLIPSTSGAKACGDNDYPVYSARVQEA